jgi:uncharacterized protein
VVAAASESTGDDATHGLHSPKIELFDLARRINVDNKGHMRPVDKYESHPFGLYMSRAVYDRLPAIWLESWIIPASGLRISKWTYTPDHAPSHDYYIDIVDVGIDDQTWRVTDLYLDIELTNLHGARLLDIDEFVAAIRAGLLAPQLASDALRNSHKAVEELVENGYDLEEWAKDRGYSIDWEANLGPADL